MGAFLPTTEAFPTASDTALGDWYVNRLVVDRQPLLLLVSSASLLPILIPARDVRGLPSRLSAVVQARLRRGGIDEAVITAEVRAMSSVVIGPTRDRSVLGIMIDFAKAVPFHVVPGQRDEDTWRAIEDRLAETPCYAARPDGQVIVPEQKASEALMAKWLANLPLQPTNGRGPRVH
jgi:hypothetical protein